MAMKQMENCHFVLKAANVKILNKTINNFIKSNKCSHVTMPLLVQAIWEPTVEKNQTNATNETMHLLLHTICIPHICHFFYNGRSFESWYFTPKNYEKHPKITAHSPKKCKICIFLRSIWKILHQTEFFTQAPPVVVLDGASKDAQNPSFTLRAKFT